MTRLEHILCNDVIGARRQLTKEEIETYGEICLRELNNMEIRNNPSHSTGLELPRVGGANATNKHCGQT